MKKHTFKITQHEIDTAVKRDSHHCMIADSIKAKFPEAKYIHVDLQSVRFSDFKTGKRFKYFTPPEAQVALLRFDQGKEVAPFTMKLKEGKSEPVNKPPFRHHKGSHNKDAAPQKHIKPRKFREYGLCALEP